MTKFFAALGILLFNFQTIHAAQLLQLKDVSSTPQLERFLSDVESHLPPAVWQGLQKAKYNGHINVSFEAIKDQGNEVVPPNCSEVVDSFSKAKEVKNKMAYEKSHFPNAKSIRYNNQVQSYVTNTNDVVLHSGFLKVIQNTQGSSVEFPCEHKNLYRLAQANLIHSLASIYDNPRGLTILDQRDPRKVRDNGHSKVSDSLRYSFLANGTNKGMKNDGFWPRALNPYEFAGNIADNFAYNMEYFLLDPEYACRKPLQQEFLSKVLGESGKPFDLYAQSRNCKVNTTLAIPHQVRVAGIDENGLYKETDSVTKKVYDLNPERVYNVYYFLAGAGAGAGAFGHSMFRIVTCKPGEPLTEKCMQQSMDLIINPRANPLEMRLDNMKGIFGGYPSMFLVTPMDQIWGEYGTGELRNLYNVPLMGEQTVDGEGKSVNIISKDQKRRFVYATLDQYWNYYGNYKFLTNNCSDETMRLYQMTSENSDILKLDIMKPFDVSDKLKKYGLADTSQLDTQEKNQSLIGALFAMLSKKDTKWVDFEKACENYKQQNLTMISRKCYMYSAVRDIALMEGKNPATLDTFNKVKKEAQAWAKLAEPEVEVTKKSADQRVCASEVPQTDADRVLKNTFEQIRTRYNNLMAQATTEEQKNRITLDFYLVTYYIDSQRSGAIGSDAVQIAYQVAFNKKEEGKDAPDVPSNLPLTVEEAQTIRKAIENYTEIESNMMPYRAASTMPSYGIPLESEVVRGDAFFDLYKQESKASRDVVEATKCLLGYEFVVYRDVQIFLKELATTRLKYIDKLKTAKK